jgi:phage terminase small subunit
MKHRKADRKLEKSGLTEKQKAFCREYVLDWNATRSYLKAYPNTKNPNTAGVLASRMLRNDKVQAYIEEIQKDLEKLCGISKAKILNEHLKIVYSSIAHLHNTWITRKEFDELTDDQKACIKSIESSVESRNIGGNSLVNQNIIEVETVKIVLYDKQKALDSISKMMGYEAPGKMEVTGKNGKPLIPQVIKIEVINNRDQVKKDEQK